MSMYQTALTTMNREMPDRIPFITRLETWYKSHTRTRSLPQEYQQLTLEELHAQLGIGQLKFIVPYAFHLRHVEVIATRQHEEIFHQYEPVIENFPGMWDFIANDKPGITHTEIITPVGKLHLEHQLLEENVLTGTEPYLKEHLIKEEADYRTVEYILQHAEFVPRFEQVYREQERLGNNAFVVPLLHRIPFQQVLLEYLGETTFFFALYDASHQVERLLNILDEQLKESLNQLSQFQSPYVEFPDNLHGMMTNPRLFRKYCLPAYQQYTSTLHTQGKKVGSHTDGDVQPLLGLLVESGLDVCESVSPAPLTPATLEEIWNAWRDGPLIWGAIPTPILEERTTDDEFNTYLDRLFQLTQEGPIILGLVDLFMRHNSIERVKQIADRV